MSQTSGIPSLSAPETAPADAQDFARCLDNAAELVEDFAEQCSPAVLEALLAAAAEPGTAGVDRALDLAGSVTKQAETLYAEVQRFLSLGQFK